MIQGHGGGIFQAARDLRCKPEDISDMSSNINPLGPPPGLLSYLAERLPRIQYLPEVDGAASCRALAHLLEIDPAWILAGSGTTQFIYSACRALATRQALVVSPTYADYADTCSQQSVEVKFYNTKCYGPWPGREPKIAPGVRVNMRWFSIREFELDLSYLQNQFYLYEPIPWWHFWQKEKKWFARYDTVFLCTPNNPTGLFTPLADLADMARSHPQLRFIIDLSYLHFAVPELAGSLAPLIDPNLRNVFLLWSGSKIFAMPGLRAGFLIAHPDALAPFRHLTQPWCLGVQAQEAMSWLAENRNTAQGFVQQTYAFLNAEKRRFLEILAGGGPKLASMDESILIAEIVRTADLRPYPSAASFMLIQLGRGLDVADVCAALQEERILVRDCSNFPNLEPQESRAFGFIRVALKDSTTNARLATLLRKIALENRS